MTHTEIDGHIVLPVAKRGRRTAAEQAEHTAALARFYAAIRQIDSRLDFKVSARGWCYLLENAGAITKAEFDRVESLLNDARKTGALPLDICAVDDARSFDCLEYLDTDDLAEYLEEVGDMVDRQLDCYRPFSFWDDKAVYLEMLVEKIDLKSLFEPICEKINVPIANAKGWPDIHVRAAMMRRFKKHEADGRQCVLLYCGDHDPAGLQIATSYRAMFADIQAVEWRPDGLIIDRFGINTDFIEEHHLTWIDNLITSSGKNLADPRHSDHSKPYVQEYLRQFGARKVEANALVVAPKAARALCSTAIERYLGTRIDAAAEEFESETGFTAPRGATAVCGVAAMSAAIRHADFLPARYLNAADDLVNLAVDRINRGQEWEPIIFLCRLDGEERLLTAATIDTTSSTTKCRSVQLAKVASNSMQATLALTITEAWAVNGEVEGKASEHPDRFETLNCILETRDVGTWHNYAKIKTTKRRRKVLKFEGWCRPNTMSGNLIGVLV